MATSDWDKLSNQKPVVKHCAKCGCRIPVSSPYEQCKECLKKELFPKVKEFVNDNYEVNEIMLADELEIDRALIHEWIQEGRLEYKKHPHL